MSTNQNRCRRNRSEAFGVCEACSDDGQELDGLERRIRLAVERSMSRFLENNGENIRNSTKERVASASYCGGMVDMLSVIRNVLGSWAVDQLLIDLERSDLEDEGDDDGEEELFLPPSADAGSLSQSDANALAAQIVEWSQSRSRVGRRDRGNPMFV